MAESTHCFLLPSIDELPLNDLDISFFQEQEEKARRLYNVFPSPQSYSPINSPYTSNSPSTYSNSSISISQHPVQSSIPFTTSSSLILPSSTNTSINPNNNSDTPKLKGAWSPEEDEKLRSAVAACDPILWDIVAESVPGRSAIQCKERWLYRLHPEVKKTRFEKWEDDLIIKERCRVGNHWTLIANKLPGRTSCAVKNRWYSVLCNRAGITDVFQM
ncbi:DNA-binding protein eta2 [Tritrichomonas foetus]|uniref:DNA-binding protein eta2 n=1 Tax=Tritrichomonas foetus TaxID=1144522 RepID=A0A1J4K9Y2_9EUKA|nr:DNA-binding protein eta2 [Tritrichomonas foetus]|eukprot:OHT06500.1 DNA-binding protein eta2 [Tritrichomonas foetus]